MKITNEQIIASARRQRQKVESQMTIPPFKRTSPSLWGGWVGAIAASLVSFFAGYALHGGMPQSQPAENPVAQVVEVQHDTIMQVQTVRAATTFPTSCWRKGDEPLYYNKGIKTEKVVVSVEKRRSGLSLL